MAYRRWRGAARRRLSVNNVGGNGRFETAFGALRRQQMLAARLGSGRGAYGHHGNGVAARSGRRVMVARMVGGGI